MRNVSSFFWLYREHEFVLIDKHRVSLPGNPPALYNRGDDSPLRTNATSEGSSGEDEHLLPSSREDRFGEDDASRRHSLPDVDEDGFLQTP